MIAERLERLAAKYSDDANITWRTDTELLFDADRLDGSITCKPGRLLATVHLSGLLALAKSSVERRIEAMLDDVVRSPQRSR